MADIFFGTDVEPSAFEISMQQIFLSGLQRRVAETGDFSSAVDATLGFKRDEAGALVPLTDQERLDVLDPTERGTFDLLQKQMERLETAFAGDLPVSERLKQRSKEQFDVLREEQGRRGQVVTGEDLETAVGFSTPAIQSIGERQRTQGILEDVERRGEIQTGFANVFGGAGMLSDIEQRRRAGLISAPGRFDVGGGGGLLGTAAQQSLFNAQQRAGALGGIGGILGRLADPTITSAAGALERLIF